MHHSTQENYWPTTVITGLHTPSYVGMMHALLASTRTDRMSDGGEKAEKQKAEKEIEFQCHKIIFIENNPVFPLLVALKRPHSPPVLLPSIWERSLFITEPTSGNSRRAGASVCKKVMALDRTGRGGWILARVWVWIEVRLLRGKNLLLLVLSVCDDIADVLVVYIASHIRGEGSPQVGHLQNKRNKNILQLWPIEVHERPWAGLMSPPLQGWTCRTGWSGAPQDWTGKGQKSEVCYLENLG